VFPVNVAGATFVKRVDTLGNVVRKTDFISNRAERKIKLAKPAYDE
jgi:hypothetical protein